MLVPEIPSSVDGSSTSSDSTPASPDQLIVNENIDASFIPEYSDDIDELIQLGDNLDSADEVQIRKSSSQRM